jgi:uncharacterized membrane protein YebE (DUF533 family)
MHPLPPAHPGYGYSSHPSGYQHGPSAWGLTPREGRSLAYASSDKGKSTITLLSILGGALVNVPVTALIGYMLARKKSAKVRKEWAKNGALVGAAFTAAGAIRTYNSLQTLPRTVPEQVA